MHPKLLIRIPESRRLTIPFSNSPNRIPLRFRTSNIFLRRSAARDYNTLARHLELGFIQHHSVRSGLHGRTEKSPPTVGVSPVLRSGVIPVHNALEA